MKNIQIFLVSLLMCIIILFSCEKEDDQNIIEEAKVVQCQVLDGIMIFDNQESFLKTYHQLKTKSFEELDQWEMDQGFKNSLRNFYQEIGEKGTDEDLHLAEIVDFYVPDDAFASILNSDGCYQIGDKIHRITKYHEFIFDSKKKEYVSKSSSLMINNKEVEVFFIKKKNPNKLQLKSGRTETVYVWEYAPNYVRLNDLHFDGDFFQKYQPYSHTGSLSFHGSAWYHIYSTHVSLGAKIQGRKKKKGKWGNDSMWWARVTINGTFNPTTACVSPGFSESEQVWNGSAVIVSENVTCPTHLLFSYPIVDYSVKFEYHDDGNGYVEFTEDFY